MFTAPYSYVVHVAAVTVTFGLLGLLCTVVSDVLGIYSFRSYNFSPFEEKHTYKQPIAERVAATVRAKLMAVAWVLLMITIVLALLVSWGAIFCFLHWLVSR